MARFPFSFFTPWKTLPALLVTVLLPTQATAGEVRSIPVAMGLASHPVNGGQCLVSDGRHQYLAFYDGEHQLTIAKRELGETAWHFEKLPEKVGWDTHNRVLLFLDRDGMLHLTGNMHCAPLKYYRTEKPGDIHSFKAIHRWTGKYEDRVTYPTMMRLRDGSVHIMYRDGGSGDGRRILVHYSEETRTWTGTGDAFISGRESEPTCNAYPFGGIKADAAGVLHIAWCWRETPDVRTNFDVCYAKSLDQGRSWVRLDDTACDLPIRPANAEVVDDIGQDQGLMNGGSVAIDRQGTPYIGYTRFDGDGHNQMYAATPGKNGWSVIQLTDWKRRFFFEGRGTIPEYPAIPHLRILGDGRLEISYANQAIVPPSGRIILSREELMSMKPGEVKWLPLSEERHVVPHVRATCSGPLPEGQVHHMQQEAAPPNRDRKPENPRPPTMIYIVETDPS